MNSTRAIRATLLATILLAFAAQCSTPSIQAPAGFAQYEGRGSEFNLVSPDAVRVRVYKTSNQPKGDLATLTNAMELHFDSLGYEVIKSQSIATNDGLRFTRTHISRSNAGELHTAFGLAIGKVETYC